MKSKLISKNKIWISLLFIILPIILIVALTLLHSQLTLVNAKAIASISLLGMLMLFFTKWTKDDGDEMYLNFRLIAAFSGLIFGVITFVVSTWFNAFVFFDDEMELFSSSISILFMMLFQMLFIFGGKVYKAKKELKYND